MSIVNWFWLILCALSVWGGIWWLYRDEWPPRTRRSVAMQVLFDVLLLVYFVVQVMQ
jgi:hypothetical protein